MSKSSTRYPYTYACDYIRALGPVNSSGVVLSRSDASRLVEGIAKALNFDTRELAEKLADAELENQEDPNASAQQMRRLMAALGHSSALE